MSTKSNKSATSSKSCIPRLSGTPPSPSSLKTTLTEPFKFKADKHAELCKRVLKKTSKDQNPSGEVPSHTKEWVQEYPESTHVPSEGGDMRSETDSIATAPSVTGRESMLPRSAHYTGSMKPLELATKHANDLFQKGKEALEQSANVKKEIKATAIECMQGMYETVLSLADSRLRHKLNLEKEQTRHARELLVIERAHSKAISEMNQKFVSELALARADIAKGGEQSQETSDRLGIDIFIVTIHI